MSRRLRNTTGVILRRTVTPAGDIIVQVLTPRGKLGAIARGGMRQPGQQSRLNLFHHVSLQLYARERDDLATVRQVTLEGALPGLAQPERYPHAHFLAELTDLINPEEDGSDKAAAVYELLTAGLRGIHRHDDPAWVALVMAMKLLAAAGFVQPGRCGRCGRGQPEVADLGRGELLCAECAAASPAQWQQRRLSPAAAHFLLSAQRRTVRDLMETPLHGPDRQHAAAYLAAYLRAHIGRVRSEVLMADG